MKSELRNPGSEAAGCCSPVQRPDLTRARRAAPVQQANVGARSPLAFRGSDSPLLAVLLLLLLGVLSSHGQSAFREFVTVRGDQLMDGDQPLRFISWNIPNLLLIEDNVPFSETNPWRLADRFEMTDALSTVRQMGGTVARTYVISVRRTNDTPDVPRHVLAPGRFNEEAFQSLDLALQVANEQGVRLIIPFVDNWPWMGGRAEYAGFRGKTKDDFWTDPQLIADFKQTIRFIVTRTNTLTGVRYSDDRAILCWETGNEVQSPASWTRQMAAYIKSLDSNHLVMDGFHSSRLRDASLDMPEVDIVTTHHYPGGNETFADLIRENWQKASGRKPYVVGEFGFVETAQIGEAIQAIRETGTAGGLLWSLRFRNRDGGFYWHSEPSGGNRYKAFHWPGSAMGDAYDEVNLMAMVRRQAHRIRGLSEPPIPTPAPPVLLPVPHAGALSWQGSVGARIYQVERAPSQQGPWTVVAGEVPEDFVQYRPLFVDETAPRGDWFYRIRAVNESGLSAASNVVGPVAVEQGWWVDELDGFERVFERSGDWEIRRRDCRQAKEDAHRAAGHQGDRLTYRLPTPIARFRVFAFFPSEVTDPKFAVSADGEAFQGCPVDRTVFYGGAGDYGYWKPVLYEGKVSQGNACFLNIELSGETQIGRVEVIRALAP